MAWTCKQCSASVGSDDLVRPKCEAPKTAWTMVSEQTRTFTLPGAKVEFRRGEGYEPVPEGDPSHERAGFAKADKLYVIGKQAVRAAHEKGLLPPSVHVVAVRLFPRKKRDLTVGLSIDFDMDEVEDREFPYEGDPVLTPQGYLDVCFLFVYGEGDLAGVELPGIDHIVDVSEDSDEGFAPSVHVTALKKRPRKLPAQLLPPWFEVVLRTTAGDPLAGWRYELELGEAVHDGELGEDGKLHLDDVAPGPGKLTLLPPLEEPEPDEDEDEGEEELALEEQVWIAPDVDPDRDGERAAVESSGAFEFSV